MFIPATFLLPQFFQGVKGATSEESGLQLLPFSLFTAVFGFLGESTCPPVPAPGP